MIAKFDAPPIKKQVNIEGFQPTFSAKNDANKVAATSKPHEIKAFKNTFPTKEPILRARP